VGSLPEHFNAAAFFVDRHVAEGRGARTAFRFGGRSVTYADLAASVDRCANALAGLGVDIEHRVLLVEAAHGIPLDIALGGLPYEARLVERSTPFAVEPAVTLMTCPAEDLVVLKAFAGRAQDWIDVECVIVRQGSRLDRGLVVAESRPLVELKEDAEAEHALGRLFAKHPG